MLTLPRDRFHIHCYKYTVSIARNNRTQAEENTRHGFESWNTRVWHKLCWCMCPYTVHRSNLLAPEWSPFPSGVASLFKLLHCMRLTGVKLRVWTNQKVSCSCMQCNNLCQTRVTVKPHYSEVHKPDQPLHYGEGGSGTFIQKQSIRLLRYSWVWLYS